MVYKIFPTNINERYIKLCADLLKKGEVIICPTDTVYAFVCDLNNSKAIEKLCRLKGLDPTKANLSVIFNDLSHLSEFTTPINNVIFRILKKVLPGAFTFIFEANHNVPKYFKQKKKTIGIRIPDNPITLQLVKQLGNPIVASSVIDEDDIVEYPTDPDLITEKYEDKVAAIIDGGYGNNIASTVVDCSKGTIELVREGLGNINLLN
ncbi:MAG: threonylcarbamoyl-AMP synthase [Bacteroidia bacterium]|nr:threonylcarbamoyl-AMP synthase [Bacteroidia bacterium]